MHITKYLNWSLEIEQHLFALEHLGAFIYKELKGFLIKLDWLAPLPTFHFHELLDDAIGNKLSFVVCRRLNEVLPVLELVDHFVNLLLGQAVFLTIICEWFSVAIKSTHAVLPLIV